MSRISAKVISWFHWNFVTIGPTSRKNWLTFGGDPALNTDYRSLFHCGIGAFRRFMTIYHSHQPTFMTLSEMTNADEAMNPQYFGSASADIHIWIWINLESRIQIQHHFRLMLGASDLAEVCLFEHSLVSKLQGKSNHVFVAELVTIFNHCIC